MKFVRVFLIFCLMIACKSNKPIVDTASSDIKKLPSRKIVKNHKENSFQSNTLDARLKVIYSNNRKDGKRKRQGLSVRLRILKDSVIWIKGTKVVSAFRAKITPTSFSYYSLEITRI